MLCGDNMKEYYVYEHVCPDGSLYIGITENINERWDYGNGYRNQKKFKDKIDKYGWKNIEHFIIGIYDNKKEAKRQEYESIMSAIDLDQEVLNTQKTKETKYLVQCGLY